MSFTASSWAWNQPCGSAGAKLVLIYLSHCASAEQGDCWPGIADIRRKTELNERTVRKAIDALLDRKLIEREHRLAPNGRCMSSIYRVAVISVEKPAPAMQKAPEIEPVDLWETGGDHCKNAGVGFLRVSAGDPCNFAGVEQGGTPAELQGKSIEERESLVPSESSQNHTETLTQAVCTPKKARTKTPPPDTEQERLFKAFWDAYPRKKAKPRARAAFFRLLREGVSTDDIIDGLARFRHDARPNYRPHPATWLNDRRWEDEPDAASDVPDERSAFDSIREDLGGYSNLIPGCEPTAERIEADERARNAKSLLLSGAI
jgi:hypothetical protein